MSATHSTSARHASSSTSQWLARHTWHGSTGAGLLHEAAHVVAAQSPMRAISATPEGWASMHACEQALSPAAHPSRQAAMAEHPGLATQSQNVVLHWANMQSLQGSPGASHAGAPPCPMPPAPVVDVAAPVPPAPPAPPVLAVVVAVVSPPAPPTPVLATAPPAPPAPPEPVTVLLALVLDDDVEPLVEKAAGSSLPQATTTRDAANAPRTRAERRVMMARL